ncbi:MAG: hypothetical protein MJ252_26895 [archaeon]|nr:hypothetical protein [archaeon]
MEELNTSSSNFSEVDDRDLISFTNEYTSSSEIKRVSLAIENLKNDNVQIRIFCAKKLSEIGQILGTERIQEELIPFITDLILNFEDNEEVLTEFSNQLLSLLLTLNKEKLFSMIGLRSLEILCGNDDEAVRQISVQNLSTFINVLDENYITVDIFALIKRLMENDSKTKMSSCFLFPVVIKKITDKALKKEIFFVFLEMGHEDSPSVRRAAIENIKNFCEMIDDDILPDLINLYAFALGDPADIVKSNAVETTPILLKSVKKEGDEKDILEKFTQAMSNEKSWRVKYTGSEIICKLSKDYDMEFNEQTFVPIMCKFLSDKEPEVKCSVLSNFDQFIERITLNKFKEAFLPIFQTLATDSNLHVRQVYASCLLKCIPIFKLDQQLMVDSIIPLLTKLLKDEVYEVQYSAIGNIDELILIANDSEELMSKCVLPIIEEGMKNPKWRFRLFIAENFLKICDKLKYDKITKYFNLTIKKLFTDNASDIREVAWKIIKTIIEKVNKKYLTDEVWEIQKEKFKSKNYIQRIASMNSVNFLKEYYDQSFLGDTVVNEIIELGKKDKVPNVKFCSFKVLKEIALFLGNPTLTKKIVDYIKEFENDSDKDVSFFSKENIKQLI